MAGFEVTGLLSVAPGRGRMKVTVSVEAEQVVALEVEAAAKDSTHDMYRYGCELKSARTSDCKYTQFPSKDTVSAHTNVAPSVRKKSFGVKECVEQPGKDVYTITSPQLMSVIKSDLQSAK
ncbi:hypothetical protein HNY73_007516 [Argiope bruennichi]|uniref:Uncharacterized protein n=1 Tax=Argiope bruennichi TaxID=94029 RepID=A0A8T0FET3_ARGBR|nr:hypothetical protein HNY73_007516 [Argiope bruennichi]